jgi:hypothetical protein
MAIGLLGMGSGLGFFFGPQYSGWRAENAGWHLWAIADWQRPCIEMGLAGVVVAVIFLIMAREAPRSESEPSEDAMLPNRVGIEAIVTGLRGPHERHHPHLVPALRKKVIAIGAVLSLRDFVGIATITLISVFLQKAYSYTPKQAGFAVGGMMLISTIINPLSVYASAGRHRLPALAVILVIGGLILMVVPLLSIGWVLPVMCVFQAFQFGSYAVSDAAILERVSPNVRGRVVGLFLTLAGTFASLSPWVMGFWTDLLGERAHTPMAYFPIFATLGGMMILASYSPRLIARLTETPQIKMPSVNANQASMLPNISS